MKISVRRVKNSNSALKPMNRTGSKNSIDAALFVFKLSKLRMKKKDFVAKMNEFGFDWKITTVYALLNQAKAIHLNEAVTICQILGCELTELFPVFAAIKTEQPIPAKRP